jgi:hypothetical protein
VLKRRQTFVEEDLKLVCQEPNKIISSEKQQKNEKVKRYLG